ncbi:MAG: glucose-1-phosphate adenylyltransferase subunit GlgD [Clostridiales bacterium]|nr:glucose-1-phosphate adenylyltransferase subunit GlgD [Clostridiales bacterium]
MTSNAFGLIYTGETNPLLRDLALSRSVAAVPFGGRYRCIDFVLSDMVNSGVTSVGLITQKNYHSLMDHLGAGKEWDLHRKREGLFMLPPFMTKENTGLYRGSVDAIRSCLGYVRRCPQQYVILTGSHTIFNMTFNGMIERHIETRANITMLYNEAESAVGEEQNEDLRLLLDANERVTEMELNPFSPRSTRRSCDVMIMDKLLLEYLVEEAYSHGEYDVTRDILLKKCATLKIMGYRYDGYVARMDSVNDYFRHNLALLQQEVRSDLFNPAHPIYTKVKDEVSSKYGEHASVKNSMLADGCQIEGTVENSIVFRGVSVKKGAVVKNSILMQGVSIGENCTMDHVILDKSVVIRDGRTLTGYDGFPIILKKGTTI